MIYQRLTRLLLLGGCLTLAGLLPAQTNRTPLRPVPNRDGIAERALRATNAVPPVARPPAPAVSKTNVVAAVKPGAPTAGQAPGGGFAAKFDRLRAHPAFFPSIIGALVCLGGWLLFRSFRARNKGVTGTPLVSVRPARKVSHAPVHSFTVLQVTDQARKVWQFGSHGSGYSLDREQTCLEGEAFPAGMVARDWRSLFQSKLNIAWLPAEHVFLRVVQLPRSDLSETVSMVEFQLERLSPIPVAQVAWSLHVLPGTGGDLQTVVVILVARDVVEEFLGKLEGQGYLADRLDLPVLDQLQMTQVNHDGAWIYPGAIGGKNAALVAWWYGGVLRNLGLLTLPPLEQAEGLKEQLMQMSWAGELEGWLTSAPEWHLVADAAGAEWEIPLRTGLDQRLEVTLPRPAQELAQLTVRRVAQTDSGPNLMPAEFAVRYRQQFTDRLWMRGLGAVVLLYLLGVGVYMAILGYASYRTTVAENYVVSLGPTYTNAIQLRDRYDVLKEKQELKYAGLDCWSTTAKLLPENVTLDSMNFTDGRRLSLNGTAPADLIQRLLDFEKEMRSFVKGDQRLFDPNKGDSLLYRIQGTNASWTLNLELNRSDVQ